MFLFIYLNFLIDMIVKMLIIHLVNIIITFYEAKFHSAYEVETLNISLYTEISSTVMYMY